MKKSTVIFCSVFFLSLIFMATLSGVFSPSFLRQMTVSENPAGNALHESKTESPKGIHYFVDSSPNSPIKDIPLRNAKLTVQVYLNGYPKDLIQVLTNENQQFILEKFKDLSSISLEVLSVDDERKYNARCSGYVTPGNTAIMIRCIPFQKLI